MALGVQRIFVNPELAHEGDAFKVYMKTDEASDYEGEFWRRGLTIANKGYAYLEEPLPSTRCVFDRALSRINLEELSGECRATAYRLIEGNWYLYLMGPESS